MYRIIGGDQKEYGPVAADDLRRWIAEGRLSGQSLVQAEGSGEWKPLSTFPEFAEASAAGAATAPAVAAPTPAAGQLGAREILARQPELQMGRCLAHSWRLLTANFGLLFGATFLVWLITIGCQFIPLIGGIVYLAHSPGCSTVGCILIFLDRIRGQPASVSEVFAGFSLGFAQLMLAGFVSALLSSIGLLCCLVLPGLYLFVAWSFSVPLVADKAPGILVGDGTEPQGGNAGLVRDLRPRAAGVPARHFDVHHCPGPSFFLRGISRVQV